MAGTPVETKVRGQLPRMEENRSGEGQEKDSGWAEGRWWSSPGLWQAHDEERVWR